MKTIYLYLTIIGGTITETAQTFSLKSLDLNDPIASRQVYNGMGCTGENLSPQLSWGNAPEGTKSFAIVMHDPDAQVKGGWTHWVIFDIPVATKELLAGAGDVSAKIAPKEAIQSKTDFETYGYGGPCPPKGKGPHRYDITIYALKKDKLGLDKNAAPAAVMPAINRNTLAKAMIESHFER
jgi:hypothetical protein